MPSSAETVSGVVCETKRLGGPPFFETAWLAFGWEPRPTPTSGWCRITFTVRSMRRERSLVTRCVEAPATLSAIKAPPPASTTTAVIAATSLTARSPATTEMNTATAKSATRLDCEYEKTRPAKRNTVTSDASSIPILRYHIAVSTIAMARTI